MKISILIATINRAVSLRMCLMSLLRQSRKPYEIIVLDNGSKDNTSDVINSFIKKFKFIKYYYYPKIGCAYAKNKLVRLAKGDIIVFIDDDCIVKNNWINLISMYHLKYPKVIGIGGKILSSNNRNIISITSHLLRHMFINECSLRKKKFKLPILYIKRHFLQDNTSLTTYVSPMNSSYKKKLLREKLFDPRALEMAGPESGYRLNKNGVPLLYIPEIEVIHYECTSLMGALKKQYNFGKGMSNIKKMHPDYPYLTRNGLFNLFISFPSLFISPLIIFILFFRKYHLKTILISIIYFFQLLAFKIGYFVNI